MSADDDSFKKHGNQSSGAGRLVYLMGASGSGKDSLLRGVRERAPQLPVAHRYITRASGPDEACVSLSEDEFVWRRDAGLFCLDWQAHGLHYGLGLEVELWLDHGLTVLVNGSRATLDKAQQRFGARLAPLLVEVQPDILRERLLRRGRESAEQVTQRLQRHAEERAGMSADLPRLDNSGELDDGIQRLLAWLAALPGGAEHT